MDIILALKEKAKEGKFHIIKREKNLDFIRMFRLNKRKISELIQKITIDDFCYRTLDREYEKRGPSSLIVIKREYELINYLGINDRICIYIKYKEVENGQSIPIISFHSDETNE